MRSAGKSSCRSDECDSRNALRSHIIRADVKRRRSWMRWLWEDSNVEGKIKGSARAAYQVFVCTWFIAAPMVFARQTPMAPIGHARHLRACRPRPSTLIYT